MVKQEINLYRPFELPLPDMAFVTWRQFLISNCAMFVLLLIIYFVLLAQTSILNKQNNALSNQNQQLKLAFYAGKSKYPSLFFTQDIQQTLQQMEKTLTAQSKFFSAIAHPAPFSQKLLALAAINIPNVWLTSISISNIDKKIVLQGNTLAANDLQPYLASLSQAPAFSNSELTIDSVDSPKAKENALSFEITMVSKS